MLREFENQRRANMRFEDQQRKAAWFPTGSARGKPDQSGYRQPKALALLAEDGPPIPQPLTAPRAVRGETRLQDKQMQRTGRSGLARIESRSACKAQNDPAKAAKGEYFPSGNELARGKGFACL